MLQNTCSMQTSKVALMVFVYFSVKVERQYVRAGNHFGTRDYGFYKLSAITLGTGGYIRSISWYSNEAAWTIWIIRFSLGKSTLLTTVGFLWFVPWKVDSTFLLSLFVPSFSTHFYWSCQIFNRNNAMLNLLECRLVLSRHLFSYLLKLTINWPGDIILNNITF